MKEFLKKVRSLIKGHIKHSYPTVLPTAGKPLWQVRNRIAIQRTTVVGVELIFQHKVDSDALQLDVECVKIHVPYQVEHRLEENIPVSTVPPLTFEIT